MGTCVSQTQQETQYNYKFVEDDTKTRSINKSEIANHFDTEKYNNIQNPKIKQLQQLALDPSILCNNQHTESKNVAIGTYQFKSTTNNKHICIPLFCSTIKQIPLSICNKDNQIKSHILNINNKAISATNAIISDYYISHIIRNQLINSLQIIPNEILEIIALFLPSNGVLPAVQIQPLKLDDITKRNLSLGVNISNLDLTSITLRFDGYKKMEYRIFYKLSNDNCNIVRWDWKDIDLRKPSTFSSISFETYNDSLMGLPSTFGSTIYKPDTLSSSSPTNIYPESININNRSYKTIIKGLKLEMDAAYILCIAPIANRVYKEFENKKERYYGVVIETMKFKTPSFGTYDSKLEL
eukprot:513285_1